MATTSIGLGFLNDVQKGNSRQAKLPSSYRFGPFHLDVAERRLLQDGVHIPVRLKAFETLVTLVENAGRLMTKHVLLEKLWPDVVVEESNLQGAISLLRKVLGQDTNGDSYIETVPRVGYRFHGRVIEVYSQSSTGLGATSRSIAEAEKSLAVLYFENLGRDEEDEYFRDGITEDVITELARIKELRIFPRSAVLELRDKAVTIGEVGRLLSASFVLEGSVRRSARQVRVTARLIETTNGHSVWAEKYDRELKDVFSIQDEIAKHIARAVRAIFNEQASQKLNRAGETRDVASGRLQ